MFNLFHDRSVTIYSWVRRGPGVDTTYSDKFSWRWRWRSRLSSSKAATRNGKIYGAVGLSNILTPLQLDHYWSSSSRIFFYPRSVTQMSWKRKGLVRRSCTSIIIRWRSCASRGSVTQVVDPPRKSWGSRTTVVQRSLQSVVDESRRSRAVWPLHIEL